MMTMRSRQRAMSADKSLGWGDEIKKVSDMLQFILTDKEIEHNIVWQMNQARERQTRYNNTYFEV
jgi:hypothetical protein